MQVDPFVSLIIGALGAALIGLLGAWIQSRREHAKWLRERRLEAYGTFMRDMNAYQLVASEVPTALSAVRLLKRLDTISERFSMSSEMVSLLGPKDVNAAGQEWVWAGLALARAKDEAAASAMSAARWRFLVVAGRVLKSDNVQLIPMVNPNKSH